MNKNRPFGLRDKVGYLFGDLGNDLFFMLVSSYLMKFYTDVMGIEAALVGTLFAFACVWNAFADVIWGRFIDSRSSTKNGKFKPWILKMSIPLVVFGALIFMGVTIPGISASLQTTLMFATYIIWGTFYSTVNIPYGSMASVISENPKDRSSLSTFRSMGAAVAGIVIGFVVPLFCFVTVEVNGQMVKSFNGDRIRLTAIIFAVLAFICYLICYFNTIERVTRSNAIKEKMNWKTTIRGIKQNQALLSIITSAIILLLSTLLGTGLNSYLFTDYFKSTTALTIASVMLLGTPLIIAPFVSGIVERFGKKEASSVALIFASIIYFLLFILPISNPYIYLSIMFLGAICTGFFTTVMWAIITDVIDYQEYLTHVREDATIYSFYSFSRKLGQAAAGGLTGFALGAIGYVSAGKGEVAVQTYEVALGIKNIATLVPSICFLIIGIILIFWYPLSKGKLIEIEKELSERRKK